MIAVNNTRVFMLLHTLCVRAALQVCWLSSVQRQTVTRTFLAHQHHSTTLMLARVMP
jgi:hypothetical protein